MMTRIEVLITSAEMQSLPRTVSSNAYVRLKLGLAGVKTCVNATGEIAPVTGVLTKAPHTQFPLTTVYTWKPITSTL